MKKIALILVLLVFSILMISACQNKVINETTSTEPTEEIIPTIFYLHHLLNTLNLTK